MIAYLEKYDTTAEIPDNASDHDVQDINTNFPHYIGQPTQTQPSTPADAAPSPPPAMAAWPATPPAQWKPNFYEALLKPFPANLVSMALTPEAQAFVGKGAEEATFGAARPLVEPIAGEQIKDHPAFADAGALTGGIGSLMVTGSALEAAGLAGRAAGAGKLAVEAGLASGERFIPRAIMTGATFGTRTFIAQTVKAFQEGGVNLEQFGKDVLKDTAFGAIFGSIGGLTNAAASVSSAAGLGFLSSKMNGADNREATLNGAIWAAFETVGSIGRSEALRMEALGHLRDSMSEYARARNPDIPEDVADRYAGQFLDNAMRKAGYPNAEAIAKSGPENLLEGIEKVNQIVRTAKISAMPPAEAPLLQKLPAPVESEAQAVAPTPTAPPQTPIQKAIDFFKGLFAPKEAAPTEQPKPETRPRTYDAILDDLRKQGHDIAGLPETMVPKDLKDIYHYAQAKDLKERVAKAVSDITGRMTQIGIEPEEQDAILSHYGMDKIGQFGEIAIPTDIFRLPIDEQYRQAYSVLAAERGIPATGIIPKPQYDEWKEILKMGIKRPPEDVMSEYGELPLWMKKRTGRGYDEVTQEARERGLLGQDEDLWVKLRELRPANAKPEKFDARTMDDAEKSVDLINAHFNPQSQEIAALAAQHPEASDHDIAQMAYNRGMLESPNRDLLEAEVKKAKQEKIINAMVAPQDTFKKWFKNSVVTDKEGKPLTVYHGTGNAESIARKGFSYEFVDKGNDQLGSGFYFTNRPETASGYTTSRLTAEQEKLGGETSPGVVPAYLSIQKPIEIKSGEGINKANLPMTPTQVKKIVMMAPDIKNPDGPLSNWGDVRAEGFEKVLNEALQNYQNAFQAIGNDFFPRETPAFLRAVNKVLGYDGVITSFPTGEKHYVAWFPGQIKSPFAQSFDPKSPKINAMISSGATLRPAKPLPEAVAAQVQASSNEISNLVNPAKAAPLAAQITRERLGKMARAYDMAEAALEDAHNLFERQPKEKNIDFIDAMERGHTQKTPQLQTIADKLRALLDDKRAEIQALGTSKLKHFIENYFPHIWDQGEKQVGQAVAKAAKRPFEGSKAFLKARSIEFTKEGVEAGLTPVSYNPVDLALLKLREMDKYIMAHRTINEYKSDGLAKYVKVGDDAPEGWTKIDDRISTVFKSPMIPVKEAYDAKIMGALTDVAKSLGINLERGTQKPREGHGLGKGELWGLSVGSTMGTSEPGKIWTRFAGPESAMAHELGHQLDNIYGLEGKFLSNAKIDAELTELAKERIPEGKTNKSFEKYIQEPSEKMAVMMEAYIHAPDLLQEKAPSTYKELEKFLNTDPKLKPLTQVEPSLVMAINKSEVYAGGAVIAGHIYAQPDAARIINNYLSPGLQKSAIYQAYRYAGNLINQFQLGFSAFHLGFTSLDSVVSKFALALNNLAEGRPLSAIKDAIHAPFSPIENIIRGDALLNAWRGSGKNASDERLATIMASAGGRTRMDQFYATRAFDHMKHHFQSGNVLRGILYIPLSLAEISSKPILEYIVPRQKLGVFSDMMKMEMEHNPNMTHDQMREIAQRAWDSVDNRMGQLVYDNLFWNRTFKDLLMGSVRSVGWNLGTIRELVGGGKDYAKAVADMARGKEPEFTYRMAYLTALPIIVGMLGAIVQYLRTGKGPQELKDYYFPKSGGVDANGDPHRIALPSYMKDLYHYAEAPLQTILNKANPIIAMMEQMWQNKDFYGTKIRNEDDPLVKQVSAEAAYMLKQITPFSIRNMLKNFETQNRSLFDTVGPWVGITPAPYDIDQTKAEKAAHEIAMSHQQIGGRTEEQAERSRLVSDLTRQYKRGDPQAMTHIFDAYQKGAITHRQMQEIIVNSQLTPLQRMTKNMTLEEMERVYSKANDEEKGQLETALERKRLNREKQFITQ